MSQKYRFRSLQLLGEETESEKQSTILNVFATGETKTIDFILLDGARQNFAYSQYITSWIGKEEGDRFIKIFFATHLVTIEGFCLDNIYNELIKLLVIYIKTNDERYANIHDDDKAFVTKIEIKWKERYNKVHD